MNPSDTHTQNSEPTQPPAPSTQPVPGTTLSSSGSEATSGPFELRELRDLGPQLPVGFEVPGEPARSRLFRLRRFLLKDEKHLGGLREKKGLTMGAFVNGVLAHMLHTVGPHSFDAMKERDRGPIITQMAMADVLYVYLYLRYEALGADEPVAMQLKCPNCRVDFTFKGDLGSVAVRVVPDGTKSLRRSYQLRDGVMIQGRQTNMLYLEPLKWGAFERPEFNIHNRALREAATVRHSIVGAEGWDSKYPFVFTDSDMDELTKYDLEGLIADIEENSPGPQMVIEAECATCRASFRAMMDWGYDSFFSRSSQRRT
jgi:hypothetical protein